MTSVTTARDNDTIKRKRQKIAVFAVSGVLAMALATSSLAGETERRQAKRMHDRLTGVPPTETVLNRMEAELPANPLAAAAIAIDGPNNPNSANFYNVTLKNFATPWTNRDQSVFEPLNDYTATVIGMVRDEVPFNQLLSADLVYVGDDTIANVADYSPADNAHYESLEAEGVDLSDNTKLFGVQQSVVNGIPSAATAGVMTSRAAAKAFFIAGTNRAMFRFTMLNHLCNDMEQVKETSYPPDRIRQDVSRSPGGDSRLFLNGCVGCHNGMDPMAQAFAYYDYQEISEAVGQLVYTPGQVQPKYFINSDNFKYGYVTPDDRWDNYWRAGPNAILGWGAGTGSGFGAKSMGDELANSDAFARCQVTKVFNNVCLRDPTQGQLDTLVTSFKSGYNLKQVFAESATQCMGN